ncbi:hypothetical protein PUR49_11370 [Streptomyces sp. BE147]|uniref:hypothetical protein n=1 Tax=Streptomyces sp. BE147 TaxID=3002524 RepID=UPI002E762C95|nr:hypothetical protein [Streptomyces sp. BE147]MEE1737091.1 hypothetical protein [Streptomyces sp. BE147]
MNDRTAPALPCIVGAGARRRLADEDKAGPRAARRAGKWWAEAHTEEPTDEALRAALLPCGNPPRPQLFPLIREAAAAARAAYEGATRAALAPSPRALHIIACHLEALSLAACAGLHPELRAARDTVEEAWESLRAADTLTGRNAAHGTARAAVDRALGVILAVTVHAERMHGTDMPATADGVREAARTHNAVTGAPEEP